MRYGVESRMKPKEATGWSAEWAKRRSEWRVLKWYEEKKDRDKALEALTHRSNDENNWCRLYEYRALDDAKKAPKKRKHGKVEYPEYDGNFEAVMV